MQGMAHRWFWRSWIFREFFLIVESMIGIERKRLECVFHFSRLGVRFWEIAVLGGGPSHICSFGESVGSSGQSCSNRSLDSSRSCFRAHGWYNWMYWSSFRTFEARLWPHSSRSMFFLVRFFVASLRSSAAVARMSSFVGMGGARGVGNQARESEIRVLPVLVTSTSKHFLWFRGGPI